MEITTVAILIVTAVLATAYGITALQMTHDDKPRDRRRRRP